MIRLLKEEEQIFIDKKMKKLGIISKMTDFSKLVGGANWSVGTELEYWLLSGKTNYSLKNMVIPHSNIRNIGFHLVMDMNESPCRVQNKKQLSNGIYEVEFGEYPTTVIPANLQKEIMRYDLEETGKHYHINGRKVDDLQNPFLPKTLIEYSYQNHKFVELKPNIIGRSIQINGKKITDRKPLLIGVLPLKWVMFEKLGIVVTEDIIISGIKYKDINPFLREYLEKEITDYSQIVDLEKSVIQSVEKRLEEIQRERKKLLDEEKILWKKLSLLETKTLEEKLKEINEEYKNNFGIEQLEFDNLLRELYNFHKKNNITQTELSILEKLMVTLKYAKGVSLKELANECNLKETKVSYHIRLTKEILKNSYNW